MTAERCIAVWSRIDAGDYAPACGPICREKCRKSAGSLAACTRKWGKIDLDQGSAFR